MLFKTLAKAFLSALKEYVKTTKTPYDDLAIEIIEGILKDYKLLD